MDDAHTSQPTTEGRDLAQSVAAPPQLGRAANAATHGLTAKKLQPAIFGTEVLERQRQRFRAEWQPATPTEACLVEELARHAAALERATPIEEAVLRTSARELSSISDTNGDQAAAQDRVLAAACGSETIDRITRYRRAHEKGFFAALTRLRELRESSAAVVLPPKLSALQFDATACMRYLRRRRELKGCPACGAIEGKWLGSRDVWQCRKCRRQVGPRSGTVCECSPLPVHMWFAAIAAIFENWSIGTDALAEMIGIRREKTVRAMAQRIREACESLDSERLLAGLDTLTLIQLAARGC